MKCRTFPIPVVVSPWSTRASKRVAELERFEGRPVTRLELVGHGVTKDFVVERELETGVGQPFCLATLEAEFGERFMRVHRNALVAVAHVRGLEKGNHGQSFVVLDGVDERVEVSRRLRSSVRKLFNS